ncbi:hypothetical protein [Candidatus Hodarchaeum mangrovi]
MNHSPVKIGTCLNKAQGKIIVQLEGPNLPKIGSYAQIKEKGQFITIGEITEAIGSTRSPWIVISPYKDRLKKVNEMEEIYSQENYRSKIKNKKTKYRYKKRV